MRKHILNKHGDKIEEVKKEVVFFNNFLMDAKRPAIPEMKPPPIPGPGQGNTPVNHIEINCNDVIRDLTLKQTLNCLCLFLGVLSPGALPFPPQGPQGLMGFGQPRPPVMGYGGACLLMINCL